MKKTIILIIIAILSIYFCKQNEFVEIPYSSIRLRVIANSNSEKDQENKLLVKEILEKTIFNIINKDNNYNNVDEKIKENEKLIINSIESTLKNNHIDTDYTYNFGMNYFPQKEYKGLTYSAGNYNSVVIKLGEAKGDNFWCVLFPPLCLIDENIEDYKYQSLIKEAIKKYN